MTERPPKESFIGHAGRLLYQPLGVARAEDRGWQSSRKLAQKGPCFKDLGIRKQWHSTDDAAEAPDEAPRGLSEKVKRQKIWLLKSHPESRLGNAIVHELLLDAHAPQGPETDAPWRPALCALGELTDKSNAQGVSAAPFVALAVGGANNILRLARLQQEEWRWKDDETFGLDLLDVSNHQPALWKDGVGSIRRMKSVVDSTRYDPTRWLIVQWESETRVFQPEFGRYPIGPRLLGGSEASRIAANPLFSISTSETGGSPHTDAAFNPNTRSKAAQLGLIDAKGYWSIWDVAGTKARTSRKSRVTLRKCGHIQDGVLRRLPFRGAGCSDWHTILWVGGSGDSMSELESLGFEEYTSLHEPQAAFPPLERSSTLLLGNSKRVRLLDLNTNQFLPDISFVSEAGLSRILEVERSPQDSRYIFVLTTTRLFVAGLSTAPGSGWDQPSKRWSILLSTPHQRDGSGISLKFNVAFDAAAKGWDTTLVTLYSTGNTWLDIFHINIPKHNSELITFCREAINVKVSQNPLQRPSLQSIQLYPVPVASQSSESRGKIVRPYAKQSMLFYQLVAVDARLNVITKLCVSSVNQVTTIAPPTLKIEKSKNQTRENKQVIRHLASRFIVPDCLVEADRGIGVEDVASPGKSRHLAIQPSQRFLKLVYDQLSDAFKRQGYGRGGSTSAPGSNPFDAVQTTAHEAVETGQMAASTLFQMIHQFDLPEELGLITNEWEGEINRLRRISPNLRILDLRTPSTKRLEGPGSSLADVYARLAKLAASVSESSENDIWATDMRPTVLRRMTCDLLLSRWGLVYGRPAPTETEQPSLTTLPSQLEYPDDDMLIASSPAPSSQTEVRAEGSQRGESAETEETEAEEPAMALLRTYTGTGRFVPKDRGKKGGHPELLGQWRVGADPDDHVFDLDREKEVTPGMRRRARVLARESRKRRRADTLLQRVSMPQQDQRQGQEQEQDLPDLPATQPAPDVRLSRRSQQTQTQTQTLIRSDPVTMSQPVPGAFAQRPKKRPKRKGGF